ncbi:uncharacterized protein [Apostichopus japonicus]|uniref:uncharacterized protein n=1 Tax=Stichopus japonicus TaxID=307972 RepID=UPI003AB3B719
MDNTPGAEGCLPLTSGCTPQRIPRPERYEVDDRPLSPPSSSYLLFDSSAVFASHPHKYRLLINKPNGGEESTTDAPSQSEHKPLAHRRSKSLVSLPQLAEDSTNILRSALSSEKISNATLPIKHERPAVDQHLRPTQLPLRKVSDSVIPHLRTSTSASAIFSQGNYSRERPEEGEDKLLRNFKNAVNLQEDKPVSFQIQPFEHSTDSMSSGSDPSPREVKSSLPASEGASSGSKYVMKEVQPEPRRLFGFGPFYRPLPETVLEKQESITEKVKKTGLSAIGSDSIDAGGSSQRKTSTDARQQGDISSRATKLESSVLMPFSF